MLESKINNKFENLNENEELSHIYNTFRIVTDHIDQL
jgi:hypothetical protein